MRKKSITEKNTAPGIVRTAPWRLTKVQAFENFKLEVKFMDGTQGLVEMRQLIFSTTAGVFAALKDTSLFNQVYLEQGVVTWPGEIDLSPDAMHEEIKRTGVWILK